MAISCTFGTYDQGKESTPLRFVEIVNHCQPILANHKPNQSEIAAPIHQQGALVPFSLQSSKKPSAPPAVQY